MTQSIYSKASFQMISRKSTSAHPRRTRPLSFLRATISVLLTKNVWVLLSTKEDAAPPML